MEQFKNKIFVMVLAAGFIFLIFPQSLLCSDKNIIPNPDGELRYLMLYKNRYVTQLNFIPENIQTTLKKKTPAVGILLSAAVPGTGEIYAGSRIKGAIFLGVEILLWWKYYDFRKKGYDIEKKYEAYADKYWDEDRWREWMQNNPEFGDTTHTLPSTKTQQYYEMIGKYDQFKAGWEGYEEGGPSLTENRDIYLTMRLNSNNEFERASTCAMLTLANHVLSSLDAAWTIRGVNRKVDSKIRMSYRKVHGYGVPFLSFTTRW